MFADDAVADLKISFISGKLFRCRSEKGFLFLILELDVGGRRSRIIDVVELRSPSGMGGNDFLSPGRDDEAFFDISCGVFTFCRINAVAMIIIYQ